PGRPVQPRRRAPAGVRLRPDRGRAAQRARLRRARRGHRVRTVLRRHQLHGRGRARAGRAGPPARRPAPPDACRLVEIYVGGLPRERRWPFDYKAGFAPADVIEEYVRPARMVEQGRVVVKEALSEPELIDFPGVGTLEAFNTDGLRGLRAAVKAPFMREKTLRYPGHVELMRAFRETGFFSKEPVDLGGPLARPRAATGALAPRTGTV